MEAGKNRSFKGLEFAETASGQGLPLCMIGFNRSPE
jgi:hypothetical protein